jgi:hypothetical protein
VRCGLRCTVLRRPRRARLCAAARFLSGGEPPVRHGGIGRIRAGRPVCAAPRHSMRRSAVQHGGLRRRRRFGKGVSVCLFACSVVARLSAQAYVCSVLRAMDATTTGGPMYAAALLAARNDGQSQPRPMATRPMDSNRRSTNQPAAPAAAHPRNARTPPRRLIAPTIAPRRPCIAARGPERARSDRSITRQTALPCDRLPSARRRHCTKRLPVLTKPAVEVCPVCARAPSGRHRGPLAHCAHACARGTGTRCGNTDWAASQRRARTQRKQH